MLPREPSRCVVLHNQWRCRGSLAYTHWSCRRLCWRRHAVRDGHIDRSLGAWCVGEGAGGGCCDGTPHAARARCGALPSCRRITRGCHARRSRVPTTSRPCCATLTRRAFCTYRTPVCIIYSRPTCLLVHQPRSPRYQHAELWCPLLRGVRDQGWEICVHVRADVYASASACLLTIVWWV